MEALRQYALSIIGAAMVCGVILGIVPKGTMYGYLKLLCGLFLTVSLLYPLTQLDLNAFVLEFTNSDYVEAEEAAALGENLSRDTLSSIIKTEAEEYILDKAAAMGLSITAEVQVAGEDIPVPMAVTIFGEVNSASQNRLAQLIWEDLAISKENQLWTGENSDKK